MKKVIRENIRDFHLDHIFDCGQAFRWEKQDDGSYTGVAGVISPIYNLNLLRQVGPMES